MLRRIKKQGFKRFCFLVRLHYIKSIHCTGLTLNEVFVKERSRHRLDAIHVRAISHCTRAGAR